MTEDAGPRIMKPLSKEWIWKVTNGSPGQAQKTFPEPQTVSVYIMNSAPTDSSQTLGSKTVTLWYFFRASVWKPLAVVTH